MPASSRSVLGLVAIALLALLSVGCSEDDKVVVQNLPASQANQSPLIITYSPAFPSGTLEQISNYTALGVPLQVVVGDPDGFDDIGVVALDVDSVIVRRFILRPDTASSGCLQYSYAPNDTVPTQAILQLPATFPGLKIRQMTKVDAGLYSISGFGSAGCGLPYLLSVAANMKQIGGYCGYQEGFGGPWVVLPPAVPTQNEAVLTYLDAEYVGNRITVWDKVGATAVLQLPNLRIVYTTFAEKNAAP